ncbi:hypothetical protein TcCL_NonESM02980, partial [Trypanosoma cruzi]
CVGGFWRGSCLAVAESPADESHGATRCVEKSWAQNGQWKVNLFMERNVKMAEAERSRGDISETQANSVGPFICTYIHLLKNCCYTTNGAVRGQFWPPRKR